MLLARSQIRSSRCVISQTRRLLAQPQQARRLQQHAVQHRRSGVRVSAYIREWPDPEFIDEVAESFPDKAIATVEEARCLFSSLGYVYLDVRPTLECEEVGKVKGSVNIPVMNSKRVWSSEEGKKVIVKEENPDFVAQVERRFPDRDTPILVACSNGTAYSIDALELLDEAGYTNLVGLKGGFYAWFRVFDNKLNRRLPDGYREEYSHGGDGCGIHGTGAGFERMDKIEAWVPPDY